jgi:hypothetical protein
LENERGANVMRRLIRKLTNVMAAVAFAEEGEAETAKELLAEADQDERHEPDERRGSILPPRHPPLAKSS